VITPSGTATELATVEADLLLGMDPEAHRVESEVALDRGSTVLMYTDGLVERRGQSLDEGIARLREALESLAEQPLRALIKGLLERLVPDEPDDDVAVVAVRLHRQDRPRPAEAGPQRVPPGVPPEPPR
jgi:serine phosphatase RsbU (regulator of sigma subunit)